MPTTTTSTSIHDKAQAAVKFAKQAEKLSLHGSSKYGLKESQDTTAVEAKFITDSDPVIELANGDRLPAVPLTEAQELNALRDEIEGRNSNSDETAAGGLRQEIQKEKAAAQRATFEEDEARGLTSPLQEKEGVTLQRSSPPSRTNPLFPPLPLYGPPSLMQRIQVYMFRITSFWLSLGFLMVIVLGSAFTSIPMMFEHIRLRLSGKKPNARRPFHELEESRQRDRKAAEKAWDRQKGLTPDDQKGSHDWEKEGNSTDHFIPTEGGKDKLVCDVAYYARRVGLDIETFKVQTEDGFIIDLWHVYDPKEYRPGNEKERDFHAPNVFLEKPDENSCSRSRGTHGKKYPILMMHGLLQSAGAYCTNDDDSLAFFLAKSGFDVWLGNNRCGFEARHKVLRPEDPRFWCWNIRQMGVLDLPALISRVLAETGFPKLGLICHSQGTTQTFVALAKEQRPDLGHKISVFCALAPAVYAGPLIGKMYFKFMRVISPGMFRVFFGLHAFIPFMMDMHAILPGRLYGAMGYRVFSFLFGWTDDRWDLGLRDRMFQFAPVYVSAESMRWWLGRECFAKHRCILSTKEIGRQEDEEDQREDQIKNLAEEKPNTANGEEPDHELTKDDNNDDKEDLAWYDEQAPPMALWIAGSDKLVDGERLLRRFERGREPFVKIVHSKVIPEYEHLDVLWAMDVIEQVGNELREVIWKSAEYIREGCIVPRGCEGL